jgi:hypothetical protein
VPAALSPPRKGAAEMMRSNRWMRRTGFLGGKRRRSRRKQRATSRADRLKKRGEEIGEGHLKRLETGGLRVPEYLSPVRQAALDEITG